MNKDQIQKEVEGGTADMRNNTFRCNKYLIKCIAEQLSDDPEWLKEAREERMRNKDG